MDFSEAYPDTCSTAARAATVGDLDSLQKLIDQGKPVDVKDNRGWISLHEAAHNGHVDCLKLILQQDESLVDFRTFKEGTALMLACRSASLHCIQHLIATGADINASNFEGYCPLWEATASGSLECVQAVVAAGANVDAQDFTGDSAIHHAVAQGWTEIVRCLLEAGIDVTSKTENNVTPLFVAAQFGQLECMKLLVKSVGKTSLATYLNMPAQDRRTPLYQAAKQGHADCVELLLELGADPHLHITRDPLPGHYFYPLQAAVHHDHPKCVELLIKVTDIERFDWPIFTPNKNPDLVGDLYRPPANNFQPLHMAMGNEESDCLRILISHGYLRQYQKSVESGIMRNIFEDKRINMYLKIKPVVTFIKCCWKWLHQEMVLYAGATKLFEYIHDVTPEMLVALLRSGTLSLYLLKKTEVTKRENTKHLLILCSHFNREGYDKREGEPSRQSCVYLTNDDLLTPLDFKKLDISLVLKLFLTPNFLAVVPQLDSVLDNRPLDRGLGLGMLNATPLSVDAKIRQLLVHCRETFTTLQQACRVNIIYKLLNNNNYTREATLNLPLPKNLQSYLLYDDAGVPGEILVDAAEGMKEVQTTVDKLFEEIDVTDLLDHVLPVQ